MTPAKKSKKAGKQKADPGPSHADLLVRLCRQHLILFHDEGGTPYGVGSVKGHQEIMPLRTQAFRDYLADLFYIQHSKVPGAAAKEAALSVLCGQAAKNQEIPVYLRVGYLGGNLYVDLCNEARQVIEITPAGWKILDDSPVYFKRRKGMKALPLPVEGGSIEELAPFLNFGSEENWRLIIAWLLASYSQGPYPILNLVGEQGTAKSTNTRVLKALADPNEAEVKAKPRDEHDLMIAAGNSWVPAYDNLTSVSPWESDAFCRLSTGGGYSTRELFTNDEETIINVKRPMILNGISDLASRGDLMSRSLVVTLPTINEWSRRPEKEFWEEFEKVKPRILGAIYTILTGTLANLPGVKLTQIPRMADFASWMTATEPMLNWPEGSFMATYLANIEGATGAVLEDSPLAMEIIDLLKNKVEWNGTSTELLRELSAQTYATPHYDLFTKMKANQLSSELRRIAPAMRAFGMDIKKTEGRNRDPKKWEKLISISKLAVNVSSKVVNP